MDGSGRRRVHAVLMPLCVRYVVAQVVVFLLFAPYMAQLMGERARTLLLWGRRDVVCLLGLLFVLAAACVAVEGLARWLRLSNLKRWIHHIFLLALGGAVLANLCFYAHREVGYHPGRHGVETGTVWLVLFGLVGYSLAKKSTVLVSACKKLCLIVSPVVLIVAGQLLRQPNVWSGIEPFVPPRSESRGGVDVVRGERAIPETPVYVFVFDMWSYQRTFHDGQPSASLKHLSSLAERSVVFHDAHSPAGCTIHSMPAFLFQTKRKIVTPFGNWGPQECSQPALRPSEAESLFAVLGGEGYRTCLVGAAFPWRCVVGDQVDVCRSYHVAWGQHRSRADVGSRAALLAATIHTLNAIEHWTDPWSLCFNERRSRWFGRKWFAPRYDEIREKMKLDIEYVLAEQPRNTFAVFHYLLPHFPVVGDKSLQGFVPFEQIEMESEDVPGYLHNLEAMDDLIGELVAVMKTAGTFEDALIVLTSDHTWYGDPARITGSEEQWPVTHVPLVIKFPGQRRSLSIASRIETSDLQPLILRGLSSEGRCADARSLVETTVSNCVVCDSVREDRGLED